MTIVALSLCMPAGFSAERERAPDEFPAELSAVNGMVRVRQSQEDQFEAAKIGMKLPEGSELRTLKNGRCEIRFTKAHVVRLGPDAKIRISRLEERKGSVRILLNLLGGRIRAVIDRTMRADADFGIYGVTTLTAVKGTDYDMIRSEEDKVTVLVNEGRVNVAEIDSEDLDAVEKAFLSLLLGNIGFSLTEGKMLDIIPGKPFPVPVPIPKGFPNIWGNQDNGHDDKPKLPSLPGLGGGLGFP